MLIRLVPKDMKAYWGLIEEGLSNSLTSEFTDSQAKRNLILTQIMTGSCVVWMAGEYETSEKFHISGFVLTMISHEIIIDKRSLLIYAFFTTENSKASVWLDGMNKLKIYALGQGCERIIFYTKNKKFLNITKHFGEIDVFYYGVVDIL